MNKNVLVISSSPRRNGNSDILCDRLIQGAAENNNTVEKIFLADKNISYCKGCGVCNTTHKCVIKDDMAEIIEKMLAADVIVLATPVYFYTMCGQMKTFIDRTVPRYTDISHKEFIYIMTAEENEEDTLTKTIESLRGFTLDCLNDPKEREIICGTGAWHIGEVKNTPAYNEAYEAGKRI